MKVYFLFENLKYEKNGGFNDLIAFSTDKEKVLSVKNKLELEKPETEFNSYYIEEKTFIQDELFLNLDRTDVQDMLEEE